MATPQDHLHTPCDSYPVHKHHRAEASNGPKERTRDINDMGCLSRLHSVVASVTGIILSNTSELHRMQENRRMLKTLGVCSLGKLPGEESPLEVPPSFPTSLYSASVEVEV